MFSLLCDHITAHSKGTTTFYIIISDLTIWLAYFHGNRCRRRSKWRGGRRSQWSCLSLWSTADLSPSTRTVSTQLRSLVLFPHCSTVSVYNFDFLPLPEIGTERACYRDMSSFPETKAEKFATRSKGKRFLQYNRRQLSRVYPRGQRLDSSNYDPLPMWHCGSQLVALNFQTPGQFNQLAFYTHM